MRCSYYGCNGEATREVQSQYDDIPNGDSYSITIHMCEKCYKEYMEAT